MILQEAARAVAAPHRRSPALGLLRDFNFLNVHLEVSWAESEDDVREAQRLRYQVFAMEMGAHLRPPPGTAPGLDADHFDPFCDHLLIRAASHGDGPGPVIGTYRLLTPSAAKRAGGLYADSEFDLSPLDGLRDKAVELGRSCVHPQWRSGGVILALWSALGRYMRLHQFDTMIGCASIGIEDGGACARRLWHELHATHAVDPAWRVRPRIPLPLGARRPDGPGVGCAGSGTEQAPPLVKGYLRCGARLLGPPALDRDFHVADLPLLLRVATMDSRYRRHFLA